MRQWSAIRARGGIAESPMASVGNVGIGAWEIDRAPRGTESRVAAVPHHLVGRNRVWPQFHIKWALANIRGLGSSDGYMDWDPRTWSEFARQTDRGDEGRAGRHLSPTRTLGSESVRISYLRGAADSGPLRSVFPTRPRRRRPSTARPLTRPVQLWGPRADRLRCRLTPRWAGSRISAPFEGERSSLRGRTGEKTSLERTPACPRDFQPH